MNIEESNIIYLEPLIDAYIFYKTHNIRNTYYLNNLNKISIKAQLYKQSNKNIKLFNKLDEIKRILNIHIQKESSFLEIDYICYHHFLILYQPLKFNYRDNNHPKFNNYYNTYKQYLHPKFNCNNYDKICNDLILTIIDEYATISDLKLLNLLNNPYYIEADVNMQDTYAIDKNIFAENEIYYRILVYFKDKNQINFNLESRYMNLDNNYIILKTKYDNISNDLNLQKTLFEQIKKDNIIESNTISEKIIFLQNHIIELNNNANNNYTILETNYNNMFNYNLFLILYIYFLIKNFYMFLILLILYLFINL